MDATSIAQEVADHLRGRDDIAKTEIASVSTTGYASIMVTTQGGVFYEVRVIGPEEPGMVTAEAEGATQ